MTGGKRASRLVAMACSATLCGFAAFLGGCGANEANGDDLAAMKGLTMADFAVMSFQQNTLSRGAHNDVDVDPGAPKE